eukprot:s6148_g3.t1
MDRPDIIYSVKEAARDMSRPTEKSWLKLKRLARYLMGKPRLVWTFADQNWVGKFVIKSDSDDAGCKETRKSTSSGSLFHGSHLIKCYSSTQHVLSLSSAESEFYAGLKAASVLLGALAMAADFRFELKGELHMDASAAKSLISRRGHGKAKHISRCYLWIQQRIQSNDFTVHKVRTDDNEADLGTKPVPTRSKTLRQLPDLISENATNGMLLVVICLAAYAKEQSNYARLLVEKAHAALWQKFCSTGSSALPVKLVAVELTEAGSFGDQYGVKEVPYCLMYMGGKQVYAKRLHGTRMAPRAAAAAKPKVLLVEPNPGNQLKLESELAEGVFWTFFVWSMSTTVEVSLLSGKTATVQAGLDETVETLMQRAQIALGVGKGRLLDSSGVVLDGCAETLNSGIQNGDSLTFHVSEVCIQSTLFSFAALLGDGSVVTWGDAAFGGDNSAVQGQLKNVQRIQASAYAFAAILGDGSVVAWGEASRGGDCSSVQCQLKNVQQIQTSGDAFAAILSNGSVVTWGDAGRGGDSSAVQDQLDNVQQIQASAGAFAAMLGNGSVVTWGDAECGGDSGAVQGQLKHVQQIQASGSAFAAILGDGSVVTWGHADFGGDSSAAQDQLKNVQQIQASHHAFVAILGDGSVVTWGHADLGGDSRAVQHQLSNVQQIQASDGAFAAILDDGSVVTWGEAADGGDSSAVQHRLKNVQQIQASGGAFAAILGDGSVVTWGHAFHGGDSTAVQGQLRNVQQIQASDTAFAAILGDGSIVTWGDAGRGGDSSAGNEADKALVTCAKNLRRNGYGSDLAMDGMQASRLAQRPEGYGILLISSLTPADQLRSVSYAIRSRQRAAIILAFDSTLLSEEEAEDRKQFLQECSYVFPYGPSYTGLAAVLARFDVTHAEKGLACVPISWMMCWECWRREEEAGLSETPRPPSGSLGAPPGGTSRDSDTRQAGMAVNLYWPLVVL